MQIKNIKRQVDYGILGIFSIFYISLLFYLGWYALLFPILLDFFLNSL